jgi:molecular chaperone Hsp33
MDELHTFLFEGQPVRGLLVRLSRGWPALLSRREPHDEHPLPVRNLLGEMTAAAVLMHANLRYAGTLILQIQGDGPLKLAVVEVNADLSYRATAKLVGAMPVKPDLHRLVCGDAPGQGRCAITLSPADTSVGQQTYQGIVDLNAGREPADDGHEAPSIADVLEHYMRQSEQLTTRFILSADDTSAGGVLVQRLPVEGEGNLEGRSRGAVAAVESSASAGSPSAMTESERPHANIDADEAFAHVAHLVTTVQPEELLRTEIATVMRRLFWQEDLRVFDVRYPSFACRCSRPRVSAMLRSLGQQEVESVLAERGDVEITCDFCGVHFRFDAVDVGEMFTQPLDQPPSSSAIN